MTIQDIGAIGEFIGSLLILVTLIYVALQNRQQQKLLLSTVHQARSDSIRAQTFAGLDIAEQLVRLRNGEELSDLEFMKVRLTWTALFRNFENTHYQFELGTVPNDTFQSARHSLQEMFRSNGPASKSVWDNSKLTYRESFQQWVDEIVEGNA